jgi:hypothetical protein
VIRQAGRAQHAAAIRSKHDRHGSLRHQRRDEPYVRLYAPLFQVKFGVERARCFVPPLIDILFVSASKAQITDNKVKQRLITICNENQFSHY